MEEFFSCDIQDCYNCVTDADTGEFNCLECNEGFILSGPTTCMEGSGIVGTYGPETIETTTTKAITSAVVGSVIASSIIAGGILQSSPA